jgi:hypothetical protein
MLTRIPENMSVNYMLHPNSFNPENELNREIEDELNREVGNKLKREIENELNQARILFNKNGRESLSVYGKVNLFNNVVSRIHVDRYFSQVEHTKQMITDLCSTTTDVANIIVEYSGNSIILESFIYWASAKNKLRIIMDFDKYLPVSMFKKQFDGFVAFGGFSVFTTAAENGHLDIIKYLNSKYVDIVDKDTIHRMYNNSVHIAAESGKLKIIKYLHKIGVDLNVKYGSHTALRIASAKGHGNIIKYLLNHGVTYPDDYADYADYANYADYADYAHNNEHVDTSDDDDISRFANFWHNDGNVDIADNDQQSDEYDWINEEEYEWRYDEDKHNWRYEEDERERYSSDGS